MKVGGSLGGTVGNAFEVAMGEAGAAVAIRGGVGVAAGNCALGSAVVSVACSPTPAFDGASVAKGDANRASGATVGIVGVSEAAAPGVAVGVGANAPAIMRRVRETLGPRTSAAATEPSITHASNKPNAVTNAMPCEAVATSG